MIDIIGEDVNILLDDFTKIKDIIYYDGPLLSHFTYNKTDYLFKWCDIDDECNRWLIIPVNIIDLNEYLNFNSSLTRILNLNKHIYIADIDNNIEFKNIKYVSFDDIPENYL